MNDPETIKRLHRAEIDRLLGELSNVIKTQQALDDATKLRNAYAREGADPAKIELCNEVIDLLRGEST